MVLSFGMAGTLTLLEFGKAVKPYDWYVFSLCQIRQRTIANSLLAREWNFLALV